jgi:hypothetical protein
MIPEWPPTGCVRPAEVPEVVTVTVAVEADVPLSDMELGDTEQVDWTGAPRQLSGTVWLNPSTGDTFTEYVAGWPGVTVAVVGEADREKSPDCKRTEITVEWSLATKSSLPSPLKSPTATSNLPKPMLGI